MKKPTINFRNLRKCSQVYRKAAELLQYEMEHPSGTIDGCCSAFSAIESMAWDKVFVIPDDSPSRFKVRQCVYDLEEVVDSARTAFKRMYQPTEYKLYWFGTDFDRTEQEHRITALLLMADIAESEGN